MLHEQETQEIPTQSSNDMLTNNQRNVTPNKTVTRSERVVRKPNYLQSYVKYLIFQNIFITLSSQEIRFHVKKKERDVIIVLMNATLDGRNARNATGSDKIALRTH